MSDESTSRMKRPAATEDAKQLAEPGSDSFWFYCDNGDYPAIGVPVEAQDGVAVFWGGVNWWTVDSWNTHCVTSWRPNDK